MGWQREVYEKNEVTCKGCKQMYVDAYKKPNQKWGKAENCPYKCKTKSPDGFAVRF